MESLQKRTRPRAPVQPQALSHGPHCCPSQRPFSEAGALSCVWDHVALRHPCGASRAGVLITFFLVMGKQVTRVKWFCPDSAVCVRTRPCNAKPTSLCRRPRSTACAARVPEVWLPRGPASPRSHGGQVNGGWRLSPLNWAHKLVSEALRNKAKGMKPDSRSLCLGTPPLRIFGRCV